MTKCVSGKEKRRENSQYSGDGIELKAAQLTRGRQRGGNAVGFVPSLFEFYIIATSLSQSNTQCNKFMPHTVCVYQL